VHSDRPARPQTWFHDSGPILETVRANRPHAARFAARYLVVSTVGLVLVAAIYLTANTLRDPGFDLASNAGFVVVSAAVLLAGYYLINYRIHRHHVLYAGAEWIGDGEGKAQAVRTYDLAHIALDGRGPTSVLRIGGSNHTTLDLPMGLLEANPALWDLLHNGLRHSAAAGARVDPATRELLELPDPGRSA
jgi:hypothetical protein